MKPPQTAALEAISRSASARTIIASFPPSSRTEGINFLAQASAIRWPVETLPVKKTFSGPASIIAAPRSPPPCSTCTSPAGNFAWRKIRATSQPHHGVSSEGFSTTALPGSQRRNHLRHGNGEGIIPRRNDGHDAAADRIPATGFRFHGELWCGTRSRPQPARRAGARESRRCPARATFRRRSLPRAASLPRA